MRRTITLALLVYLLLPAYLFAQKKQGQARIDSLLAEVPKMKDDTAGVRLVDNLALEYSRFSDAHGLYYARREFALAQRIGYKKGIGWSYTALGNYYFNQVNVPLALKNYFIALGILEDIGDKQSIAVACFNIAEIYEFQKSYGKALNYAGRAQQINTEVRDRWLSVNIPCLIANVHRDQGQLVEAIEFYKKELRVAEDLGETPQLAYILLQIGDSYNRLRQPYPALVYNYKSLRLSEETGDKKSGLLGLGDIGESYFIMAKDGIAQRPDSLVPAGGRSAILAKGISYLKKCLENYPLVDETVVEFAKYLSDSYLLQGDYNNALIAYKKATSAQDSLYNTLTTEKITKLETERAVELKDKDIQIATLKKRNERIPFIAGGMALVLVAAFSFSRYKKQKLLERSSAILNERLRISRDLHDDMGATLSSISVYSTAVKQRVVEGRFDEAQNMLDTISVDARDMVGNMSDMVWMINPQNDRMEKLLDRMELFAANVLGSQGIPLHFSADKSLRELALGMDARKDIFLLFKEAVNNIAKYAAATEVTIRLEQSGTALHIIVRDNGRGFNTETTFNGNGLRNMRERAKSLHGSLSVISTSGGTEVALTCTPHY